MRGGRKLLYVRMWVMKGEDKSTVFAEIVGDGGCVGGKEQCKKQHVKIPQT